VEKKWDDNDKNVVSFKSFGGGKIAVAIITPILRPF